MLLEDHVVCNLIAAEGLSLIKRIS